VTLPVPKDRPNSLFDRVRQTFPSFFLFSFFSPPKISFPVDKVSCFSSPKREPALFHFRFFLTRSSNAFSQILAVYLPPLLLSFSSSVCVVVSVFFLKSFSLIRIPVRRGGLRPLLILDLISGLFPPSLLCFEGGGAGPVRKTLFFP